MRCCPVLRMPTRQKSTVAARKRLAVSSPDSHGIRLIGRSGLFLSTQYWDTYTGLEAQGQLLPPNQWTLHGLWPDFCNGSFTQYCDLNRQYDPT